VPFGDRIYELLPHIWFTPSRSENGFAGIINRGRIASGFCPPGRRWRPRATWRWAGEASAVGMRGRFGSPMVAPSAPSAGRKPAVRRGAGRYRTATAGQRPTRCNPRGPWRPLSDHPITEVPCLLNAENGPPNNWPRSTSNWSGNC